MGRVKLDDLDHYNSGSSNFFQLKEDKEVAKVRIMINKLEDIENYMFACHKVDVAGSMYGRNVNCLRSYNEPIERCPLCAAGFKPQVRIFIPLYNEDEQEVQIFERGRSYMSKFSSFVSRYSNPRIVSHMVEVERNGKPKDMKTTYELYEVGEDGTTLEDLPEVPDILGSIVLNKSAEDMNYYLDSGDDHEFPMEEDNVTRRRQGDHEDSEQELMEEEEQPIRRGNSRRSRVSEEDGARTSRRTPASGGNRRRSY